MTGYTRCFACYKNLAQSSGKFCTNYCLPARPKPWTCEQFQPRIQPQAPRTHRYGAPHNPQLSSRPLTYHLPPDPSAAGSGSALFPQSEGASRPGSHNLPEEELLQPATLLLKQLQKKNKQVVIFGIGGEHGQEKKQQKQ